MQIVRAKIWASERIIGQPECDDPIETYFPPYVNEQPIEAFILDRSFYKPRDIVWRLSIAQRLFPNETAFTIDVLLKTEIEYSSRLWDEIRYELGATYSDREVGAIEGAISGGKAAFHVEEIVDRFERSAKYSSVLGLLLERRSVQEILSDLYRLGAIGNSFRVGTDADNLRNRWVFRGDPSLLVEKRMVIHPALVKRLSAVRERRRGPRGRR